MSRMFGLDAGEAVASAKGSLAYALPKAAPRALNAGKSALTHICADGRNAA